MPVQREGKEGRMYQSQSMKGRMYRGKARREDFTNNRA